jgi:hypothetical protein
MNRSIDCNRFEGAPLRSCDDGIQARYAAQRVGLRPA